MVPERGPETPLGTTTIEAPFLCAAFQPALYFGVWLEVPSPDPRPLGLPRPGCCGCGHTGCFGKGIPGVAGLEGCRAPRGQCTPRIWEAAGLRRSLVGLGVDTEQSRAQGWTPRTLGRAARGDLPPKPDCPPACHTGSSRPGFAACHVPPCCLRRDRAVAGGGVRGHQLVQTTGKIGISQAG